MSNLAPTLSALLLSALCVLATKFVGGFNLIAVAVVCGLIGAGLAMLYEQSRPIKVVEDEEGPDDVKEVA